MHMRDYGLIRVASAVVRTRTADVLYNAALAERMIAEAEERQVSILAFSELSITGYTCADLFLQNLLTEAAERHIRNLLEKSRGKDVTVVIGAPLKVEGQLYDCAIVMRNGRILGTVPKTCITPSESRWFTSGRKNTGKGIMITYAGQECLFSATQLFQTGKTVFAVEIGSDVHSPVPPSSYHALCGAGLIVNLSADPETAAGNEERKTMLRSHSARTICGYLFSGAAGESTQDTVYSGASYIWENGCLLAESERYSSKDCHLIVADMDMELIDTMRIRSGIFSESMNTDMSCIRNLYTKTYVGNPAETDFEAMLERKVEPHPFTPEDITDGICSDILQIQTEALCTRLEKTGAKAVLGISGGLDSTLALLVTIMAFDRLSEKDRDRWSRKNIIAVTMPGFGTTVRTRDNALDMMETLGVTCRNISIVPACEQHFMDIGHDISVHDATYENTQARERTQILMDIANHTGGIVIGTGDLSELALGWATYNGDQMSMYGVNAGVPKTLVRSLVTWTATNRFAEIKETLLDIAQTPISPELLPGSEEGDILQMTEDLVGPYELHDFFIYNFMKNGYSPAKIFFMAQKAFMHPCGNKCCYDRQTILKWLKIFIRRFFSQQFKRSCMPDGPKVTEISLSPRGAWQMPSDSWDSTFIDGLTTIQ